MYRGRSRSVLVCIAACSAPARSTPVPPQVHPVDPACLSIGAWNDLHGQISPDEPVFDTGVIPAGGVIALADAISDLRATKDTVVLLDAGDLFTGPLESTLAEGAPIIEAYRVIGVDAAAVGNHEFDFGPVGYDVVNAQPGVGDAAGPRGPRGALVARMRSASFPFLSANIHLVGGGSPGWPNFSPSVHIRRGAFDVGVVGYTTQETPMTTSHSNVADLDFATNAGASVAAQIRALRASGASPVVLLAHAGLDGVLPERLDTPASAGGELASLVAALGADRPDVIIAGHRHVWMLGRLDGIPVVSNDQHGVGLARIRFCRDRNRVELRSIERVAVLAASPPRTALGRDVDAVTAPWIKAVKAKGDELVATLRQECPMQNADGTSGAEQVAIGILKHASDAATAPRGVPIVALMNAGAIRAPLHRGIVRYADLFNSFPFETTVAVCGTTRAGLAQVLRNALRDPSAGRKFPFALAGAKATIALLQDGTPSLVGFVLDHNRAATNDSPIWLALPDFVLDGGDSLLDGVTCTATARSSTHVRDVWQEILAHDPDGCGGPPSNVIVLGAK